MTKSRAALLGIVAALAVSAAAAATASAHEFLVEGSAVTSLVDGTFTSATSHLRYELSGAKVDIVSNVDSGSFSLSPSGVDAATISFTSNALYETNAAGEDTVRLSSCTVNEGKPITFAVDSELAELSGELVDALEGAKPPLFVSFSITGAECALKKPSYEVTGSVDALLPEGEVNKALHILEFEPKTGGSQSLELFKKPATITSKESLVLSGANAGKGWSSKK
jgi:hypothetical protein